MNPKKPQNGSALSLNVISEETHLEGNITSTSDFRIAGRVYGDLDIKGKLLLTSEAVIRGEIRVD
jgi:cytoskeletal protein CcmA (bactofilin family)